MPLVMSTARLVENEDADVSAHNRVHETGLGRNLGHETESEKTGSA